MKILLLAPQPFFQNRGTPIAVKLLLEILANAGHKIHLIVYHEGEDIEIPNVTLHRIPPLFGIKDLKPGFSFKKIVCDIIMTYVCIKMLHNIKFDLIHAVEESVFIATLMKLLYNIPFIYDMDSSLSGQLTDKFKILRSFNHLFESFEKTAVHHSIGVIAVCKSLEKTAIKYDNNKKILRLEDISLLTDKEEKYDPLRKALNITGPIIMYVGNLENYQGIDLLLESFHLLSNRLPGTNLVIIGGSNIDIKKYKTLSRQLGKEKSIHFIGPKPLSQLGSYLKQADILVSPRIKGENTPMKIYSYLDSGKPLVATALPTHTQVLDEEIAMLVPPDTKKMAEGFSILINDDQLAKKMASQAKKRVKKEFSFNAFKTKLLNFYELMENEK